MTTRTSPSPPPSPEVQQFNAEIESLLKAQNPRARSLNYFIKRTLRQFHLDGTYTEVDVFNEAYTRGICLTQKGTAIANPKAWMRKTALNIIRELSRNRGRYHALAYDELTESHKIKLELVSTLSETPLVSDEAIELDIRAVSSSLQELSEGERRIIELRQIQNLSWKEVGQHLIELGEEAQTETALRKQGQRAMERFRRLYHQKRPSTSTKTC